MLEALKLSIRSGRSLVAVETRDEQYVIELAQKAAEELGVDHIRMERHHGRGPDAPEPDRDGAFPPGSPQRRSSMC